MTIPATLHASLMARLDRLGPAKEVAQIGAAIGRDFSNSLLAAVVMKPEMDLLQRWMDQRTRREWTDGCCRGRTRLRMGLASGFSTRVEQDR